LIAYKAGESGAEMRATKLIRFLGNEIRKVLSYRLEIKHSSIIRFSLISIIIMLAIGLRVLPLPWGFYLNEFDPYFHYYSAKYILENGLSSFFSWHDWAGWWPYGRYMPSLANMGLSLTAVTLYRILQVLGIPLVSTSNPLSPLHSDPLFNLCVIFPILASVITCILAYFLGRSLGGDIVGLLSALLLALDPAYIGRTSLGWFDDETVGILSVLLIILSFSRAIDANRVLKNSLIYSILTGLSLGYLCISWGAARYLIGILVIFTIVLLLMRKYTPRLLTSYTLTFVIALTIAASSPRLGVSFMLESFNLAVYGTFILLLMAEVLRREKIGRKKILYALVFIVVLIAAFASLTMTGVVRDLGKKFVYAILPHLRSENPLFESVAEHKPSGWATFYNSFGPGLIFIPVGIFFAVLSATNLSLLLSLYCLTSIYFASSMIRLLILASPAVCMLWALAIKKISLPLVSQVREETRLLKRKVKVKPISKEVIGGILVLFLIIFILVYILGTTFSGSALLSYADAPTAISGASLSVKPSSTVRDWIDTLIWMRDNLPPSPRKPGENGTVVASWWDYGYWITVFANKTTLADNGTINGTQIQQIGRMFMSNETEAVEILKRYNVTHVVVFVTFHLDVARWWGPEYALYYGGAYGGDNGKWRWMALIPGLSDRDFGNITLGWDWVDKNNNRQLDFGEFVPNSLGQNTTLYKLMMYGIEMATLGFSRVSMSHFKKAYFSREYPIYSVPETNNIVPLVCVYEVIYD